MDEIIILEDDSQAPRLVSFNSEDHSMTISKDGKEISTSSYGYGTARGNVKVKSGKWYYEVTLKSAGCARIGWCTKNYAPASNYNSIGDDTESWGFDGSRKAKSHNEEKSGSVSYGDYWSSGDVIGCLLDLDLRRLSYSINGRDLGVAFTNVRCDDGLYPAVSVYRGMKLSVNFGRQFTYLPVGVYSLNPKLSNQEKNTLIEIYNRYADTPFNTGIDSVIKENIIKLATDLGSTSDEDPLLLIVSWKLRATEVWEISGTEWILGWTLNNCFTFDQMRNTIALWKQEVNNNPSQYRSFYNFVFDYLKPDKSTALDKEEALIAWSIVGIDKKWDIFDNWRDYIQNHNQRAITRDTWQMLLTFIDQIGSDITKFDSGDCWPSTIDEFMTNYIEKHKNK